MEYLDSLELESIYENHQLEEEEEKRSVSQSCVQARQQERKSLKQFTERRHKQKAMEQFKFSIITHLKHPNRKHVWLINYVYKRQLTQITNNSNCKCQSISNNDGCALNDMGFTPSPGLAHPSSTGTPAVTLGPQSPAVGDDTWPSAKSCPESARAQLVHLGTCICFAWKTG